MKEEKRKLNVVLWSRNCFVVRQFSSPRATEMTLGLKQQSEKNVCKTRKLPFRSVHCNTCMISLFVTLWTIPSWNMGRTIKNEKLQNYHGFEQSQFPANLLTLALSGSLICVLSPPHHLRLVGWAGIHTNYQITQGPLRRPPSSNQSNSIRFGL